MRKKNDHISAIAWSLSFTSWPARGREGGGRHEVPAIPQPHTQPGESALPVNRQQVEVVVVPCQQCADGTVLSKIRTCKNERKEGKLEDLCFLLTPFVMINRDML